MLKSHQCDNCGVRIFVEERLSEGQINFGTKFILNKTSEDPVLVCGKCLSNPASSINYSAVQVFTPEVGATLSRISQPYDSGRPKIQKKSALKSLGESLFYATVSIIGFIVVVGFIWFIIRNSPMPGNNP